MNLVGSLEVGPQTPSLKTERKRGNINIYKISQQLVLKFRKVQAKENA